MPLAFTTPLIERADDLAARAHWGTYRKYSSSLTNQTPYIDHPRRVAEEVSHLPGATEIHVAAALLHDVEEDCDLEYVEELQMFPEEVAKHVHELTNASKKTPPTKKSTPRAQRKLLDRKFLALADKWTRKIKLVDRKDNVNDLDPATTPHDFYELYCEESVLLVEALKGTDKPLETALSVLIKNKLIELYSWRRTHDE